ncbi:DUF6600 domain-containing protein [Labrys wisconsinensis]|uniref:Uncharacterized protein n=1 Tax=Labrys wisconsinensis TaxID=425677 RepID=A0ABU0JAA3_9HYPH|nr:DUF6600 domain-containing protein [Labrys wisconsinensis]MDQ0471184.1 hypothetical protein [Labrys wisconsinensis]
MRPDSMPSSRRLVPGVARGLRLGILLTVLVLAGALLAAGGQTPAFAAAGQAIAQGIPPTLDDFKQTLSQYGRYVYSERYGNVWRPSTLPPGWHPYPACHWAYDRTYGWMYDDQTPWGKIVHHYGRWAHDDDAGWVWVPGAEWSPAWVIWRTSPDWSGWAPTPPAADQQETTVAAFESDKQWTFIETAKLANRCDAEPAAAPADVFKSTTIVTTVKIIRNVAVYVIAPPPGVVVVDYDTGPIAPWPSAFLGDWISLLSAVSAGAPIAFQAAALCAAPAAAPQPFKSLPPPPPGLIPQGQPKLRQGRLVPDAPPPARIIRRGPVVQDPPVVVERPPIVVERPPVVVERPPVIVEQPPIYRPGRPRPPGRWPPPDHGPIVEGGGHPPRGPGGGRYPGDIRFPGGRPPIFHPGPGNRNMPFPRRRLPMEGGGPIVR